MPFSSVLFVHLFLPVFLAVYWLAPRAAKNGVAIAASLVFYAWGAPRFLPVVFALGCIDYFVSHRIAARQRPRLLLALGVTMHLSILAYFKYSNFFVGELARIGFSVSWSHVVLPIGVSFITFEEISYLCDVYRGDAKPARKLSHYLLFLTLFPHSIAGPIFRWKDLEHQLAERVQSWTLAREGFERFGRGLAKKILIADSVGLITDAVFALPSSQISAPIAWLGAIAYAIQIYFDFSGYTDMAIGLGKMMGFQFKENFNLPYISSSVTEFWTRWHISLSTWLRDYLYIPLGGNRRGRRRALINIMIVFALSGLWHGAAWTFVLWGGMHGLAVMIERLLGERRERVPVLAQHVLTLGFVVVAWVLFRASSAQQAFDMIGAMFGAGGGEPAPAAAVLMPRIAQCALALGIVIVLAPIVTKYRPIVWPRFDNLASLASLALMVIASMHLLNLHLTPLIYFKF